MEGHSKIRNRAIASIFNKMGLVESWGTGVRRIIAAAENYGLPQPEIQVFDNMIRVNLFRKTFLTMNAENIGKTSEKDQRDIGEASEKDQRDIGEASEKHRRTNKEGLNATEEKILKLLSEDAQLPAAKMADKIGISRRNIEVNIKKLKERGILIRHGSPKKGYWEIVN